MALDFIEYWVWLQTIFRAGSVKPARLLEAFSARAGAAEAVSSGAIGAVYAAGREEYDAVGGLTRRETDALCDKSLTRAEAIMDACLRCGVTVVAMDSPAYPDRLRHIYAPPVVLYIAGTFDFSPERLLIAVVGTRTITAYGYEAATKLSMGIAAAGAVVVSGLAVGVDGAAHRGALKAGGKTVAVIGCGSDIPYPSEHVELKRLIAAHGAVVSEFPPGTRPDRTTFPIRNRIIAGLSQGTVVVEAGTKSGALITASLAAEMGRDVFAVPGSIFSPMSEGPNRLIRDGAKPVCSSLDVLEEYPEPEEKPNPAPVEAGRPPSPPADTEPSAAPAPRRKPSRSGKAAGLSETQAKVYTVLCAAEGPEHVDDIALKANLELRVVLAVMTSLEIQGFVRSLPGKRYLPV